MPNSLSRRRTLLSNRQHSISRFRTHKKLETATNSSP